MVSSSIPLHERSRKWRRTRRRPSAKSPWPTSEKSWFCRFCTPAQYLFTSPPDVVEMLPMTGVRNWYSTT